MATDGDTDFTRYDRSQLEEALGRIDRERYPINFQRLAAEIQKRQSEDAALEPARPVHRTQAYQLEFRGNTPEYFRIWIVNLALTILTLGIYSAWAKVRKQRYFHGNTYLAGSAFGYHAEPIQILKGRIIAACAVGAYFLAIKTSLKATGIVIAVILIAGPWLLVKSRRFTARVTSWRGLRFGFKPDYSGAYRILLGWLVLSVLTFGLLLPRLTRERYRFIVSRSSYGNTAFECNPGIGRFYKTAFAVLGLAIVVILALSVVMIIAMMFMKSQGHASARATQMIVTGVAFLEYALLGPLVLGYTYARNVNEVLNHTTVGGHDVESKLEASKLIGIYFGNVFAIVGSLGLLIPWAQIRLARYRAGAVTLHAVGDLDEFTAQPAEATPSAVSEELSSFLNLDFGF